MGVPRAITVLRDRYGAAPRGKLRGLISQYNPSRARHDAPWKIERRSDRLWSESQLEMVDLIEDEALKAGLNLSAAAAMVVNSRSESGLKKDSVQPGQPMHLTGVGLFQLTADPAKSPEKGTFAQRKDPVFNTQYMLSRYELKAGFGAAFRKAMAEGAGVDSLASIFARDLERCAECASAFSNGRRLGSSGRAKELVGPSGRAALARLMFPTLPHTGDINPQVEAKPHHGGAWSSSKPPDINYTPAPVPQTYEVPGKAAPLPRILTNVPAPAASSPSVDTVLVAPVPAPASEPDAEPTITTKVASALSLTPQQLLGIGVASAVVATFAGVLIVRNRRLEASRPLSYSGAR